jgi:putative transposase
VPYEGFEFSLGNVEDLLHEHGIDISHETLRYWHEWVGAAPPTRHNLFSDGR